MKTVSEFAKKHTWKDILARNLHGYTILLDIDGVLMADGEDVISSEIVDFVGVLKEHNNITIVSNTIFKKRRIYAGEILNIPILETFHRKPSVRILNTLSYDKSKPLLVIGDKILTDGIFAKRINSELILLTRRTHRNDRLFIKLTYIIDDLAYSIFGN